MKARSKSLLQSEENRRCIKCGALEVEKHHIFYGTANRQKSDEDGCWCWLCPAHHRGDDGVHGYNYQLRRDLFQRCQLAWESRKGTRKQFVERYGKNYLEDRDES